jgi:hypothetical protein
MCILHATKVSPLCWYRPIHTLTKTHLVVHAPLGQQLSMRATFSYLSASEYDDQVCIFDSTQAMSYRDGGPSQRQYEISVA